MIRRRMPTYAPEWAFFLDVDGTLLDFAAHPQDVFVDPGLRELLAGLHRLSGGALALVSGRSVADVDQLFAPLVFPAAGLHGIERRSASGEIRDPLHAREAIGAVAGRIAAFVAANPGLGFEDKGLALAMHYRRAPYLRSLVEKEMRLVLASLGPGFELQKGKFVVEIRPTGRDKGDAIAEFVQEPPFAGRVPVFIGDDLSDEHGFAVVNRLGGHSFKVGPGITQARWRLFDAPAVRRWLSECLALGTGRGAHERTEAHG